MKKKCETKWRKIDLGNSLYFSIFLFLVEWICRTKIILRRKKSLNIYLRSSSDEQASWLNRFKPFYWWQPIATIEFDSTIFPLRCNVRHIVTPCLAPALDSPDRCDPEPYYPICMTPANFPPRLVRYSIRWRWMEWRCGCMDESIWSALECECSEADLKRIWNFQYLISQFTQHVKSSLTFNVLLDERIGHNVVSIVAQNWFKLVDVIVLIRNDQIGHGQNFRIIFIWFGFLWIKRIDARFHEPGDIKTNVHDEKKWQCWFESIFRFTYMLAKTKYLRHVVRRAEPLSS